MNPSKTIKPQTTQRGPSQSLASPLLYSIRETASLLGLSRTTIFGLLKAGTLTSVRIGRRRMISADAVFEFIAKLGGDR